MSSLTGTWDKKVNRSPEETLSTLTMSQASFQDSEMSRVFVYPCFEQWLCLINSLNEQF